MSERMTMGHYKSNLRDIEFNLFEVFGADDRMGKGPYAEMDSTTARDILREVERLASGPLAESFADADRNPPVYDPAACTVVMPEGFKKSFKALMDAEWWRLDLPEHLGGTGAPPSLRWAASEMLLGSNPGHSCSCPALVSPASSTTSAMPTRSAGPNS